jgi:hypothetical protein
VSDVCRSCGASILWAAHEGTGRLAPLEPVQGGSAVLLEGGRWRAAREGEAGDHDSHFAYCPDAVGWRRARGARR